MQQAKKDIHPATAAQEFMSRTRLEGREVEVYAQTFNWLAEIIEGNIQLITKDLLTQLQADSVKLAKLNSGIPVLKDKVEAIDNTEEINPVVELPMELA